MCGIVGFQGAFDDSLLRAMAAALAHRGPDGDGFVLLGPAGSRGRTGFGHRRLAIIDLSPTGAQPMTTRCGRCGSHRADDLAITYNGELYNYRALRDELRRSGHEFRGSSDTEVILHLYAEHGLEMFGRLNGIFGLAIRDGRARGRPAGVAQGDVIVARDALGVKPLYWTQSSRGILFASELKALLCDDSVARDLDPLALHYYLAYLWTPAPRTMLSAVRKLPPGHFMHLRDGERVREERYYQLPHAREHFTGTADDIAAALREELFAAVDRQMVSDVPVGAFLSGGLDSSAVVAMMRRAAPENRPVCYTIAFQDAGTVDGAAEDLPYARRVAQHLGVELREIIVGHDVVDSLERMLYFIEEPQADPAPLNAMLIAEQARRDGYKVLLSGAGGDDIFSGYRRHRALELERWWGPLPTSLRSGLAATARWIGSGANVGGMHSPSLRRAVKAFAHADRSPDERLVSYFFWSDDELRRGLYGPALAGTLSSADAMQPLLQSLADIPGERSRLNRMLHLECRHFLADHNLNYTDKMGMAEGVEIRVPLLDLELVEFASRVPPHLKQQGAEGKAIFKRAMRGLLPDDVIYRPKTGFGAPLRRWLRHELRDTLENVLSPSVISQRGLFDPQAVARLVQLDRAGRVDGTYTLFALMCVEMWCRLFIDGKTGTRQHAPEPEYAQSAD